MDMTDVKLFNAELSGLYDNKPPISKAKMSAITRSAIKAIKFYKHVVHSVEKFILKCKPEYKVPGLYVIDSIVRQSRHQFGQEKDVFAPRFAKNMQQTFANLFRCPPEDKRNIIRVLNLWQKNNVFSPEVIQPLLDMADPNHPIHQEILQSNSANGSLLNQSGVGGEHKSSPAMQQSHTPQRATPNDQHSYSQSQQQSGSGGKFKRLLNDFEYESEEEGASASDTAYQPPPQPMPPTSEALGSILTNPEILRQLQSLQAQMNMMAGMQGLPNLLPQLSEIQLQGPQNNSIPFLGSQQEMPKNLDTNEDNTNNESDIEFVEQGPQVIEIDANDSRSPSPNRSRRRRSRSRSESRKSHSRRKSRSRSRERDARWDRRRDKERSSHREKEKEKERELEREREKEREKKGLPPIKKDNLSVCSTTLWVGHLSKLASAEDLSDVFGAIGGVSSIDVVPPRGCAFVAMERRRDAAKALAKLDRHKLHSKEMTVAWAPGKGVKGREWKDYWESEWGVSYLPWDKLEQQYKLGLVNFELLEEGGMFDEDTYPPWMPPRILQPKSLMEGMPPVMVPPGGMVPPMGLPPGGIPLPPGLGMPPVGGNIPLPIPGGGKPPTMGLPPVSGAMGLPPASGAMSLPPTSATMSLPNADKMAVPSGNVQMPARPNIPMPLGMPPPAIAARLGLPAGLPPGLAPRVPTGAGNAMPAPTSLLGFPPGLPPQAGMMGGFLGGLGLPLGLGMGGVPMMPPHLLAHQHRQLNQANEAAQPDDSMDMDLDTEENAPGEEHGGDGKPDGAASAVPTLPDQLQALLSQPPPNFNFADVPPSISSDGNLEHKEDETRADGDRGRDKERERDRDRRDRDRRDRKDRDRDRRDRDRGRDRDSREPRDDRRDRKDGDRDRKDGDRDRRDGERDRRDGERDRREGDRERRDGDRDRRDGDRDRRDGERDRGRDKRDRDRDRWPNRAQSRDKTQASEGGTGEKTLQERLWEMANGNQPMPEEPMESRQGQDREDDDDRDHRGHQSMLDAQGGDQAEGEDNDGEGGWTQLPPARLLPQPQPAFRADLRMRGPNRGPIRGPWMDESLGPRFNGGPPFNRPSLVGNRFDGAPRFDRPPFNRMPFDGPMRPPFDGPRPPFDGPRPPFEGMRMPFDGPRPLFDGPRPPFDGPRPPFDGFRPPFDGPRPRFDGPRPPFDGPRQNFDGPPRFDGSRPEFFDRNNRGSHFENDRDFNERGGWKGDRPENEREWDHRRNERQGDWDDRRREKRSRDDERHQDGERHSRDRDKRWNRDDRERGDREKDKDNSKDRRGKDRERKSSRWAADRDTTTEDQPELSQEALEKQQAALNTAMSIISKLNENAPVEEQKSENTALSIERRDVPAPSLYDENEVGAILNTESIGSKIDNSDTNEEKNHAGKELSEQIIQAFNAKCDNSLSDNETQIFSPGKKNDETMQTLEKLEKTETDSVYTNVNKPSDLQDNDINTECKNNEAPTKPFERENIFDDARNDIMKDRDLLDEKQYSFEPAVSNQVDESIQEPKAAVEKESICDESKVSKNIEGSEQTANTNSGDITRDADDVASESVEEAASTSDANA